MRLIDADALKEIMFQRKKPEHGANSTKERWRYIQWLTDYRAIEDAPTIDRPQGKWIRITDEVFADRFECSECGKLPPIENFEWWLSDYCPNCGADMRGNKE